MYQVVPKKKQTKKITLSDKIYSFPMASSKKIFLIEEERIKNIVIINTKLAYPLVEKKVKREYMRLITLLMDLLTSDDDTGESFKEALNRIEKFRQEIKNKYRHYLKRKELEEMGKQLKLFQKEASIRMMELQNLIYERNMHQGKGK